MSAVPRALIIDDVHHRRQQLAVALAAIGWDAVAMSSALEGVLALYAPTVEQRIDAVFAPASIRGVCTRPLFQIIESTHPSVTRVLIAEPGHEQLSHARVAVDALLWAPWSLAELLAATHSERRGSAPCVRRSAKPRAVSRRNPRSLADR